MSKSAIEWTEQTWNPIVGCSIVSPGCINCYAMKTAARNEAMGISRYDGTTKKVNGNVVWTGKLAQAPEATLLEPLRRKKPTTYFVNSMGDLFHEDCPDEWIDRVFAVMALAPQHTFQVLTKRAARMRDYCSQDRWPFEDRIHRAIIAVTEAQYPAHRDVYDHHVAAARQISNAPGGGCFPLLPLKNVWLGVSTERQQEADERIPLLLQTPAAVRFISAEPLLGPIDLTPKADATYQRLSEWYGPNGFDPEGKQPRLDRVKGFFPRIDWVIVGAESGPNARPMHPRWAQMLRDQCATAGVAFFFKQWGEWTLHTPVAGGDLGGDVRSGRVKIIHPTGQSDVEVFEATGGHNTVKGSRYMARVGKKSAGRLLDGIEHNAMPGSRA